MNDSIGKRLVKSFLTIIIFTIVITDFFLIFGFKKFYYSTVENELENRLNVSIDSYNKFFSERTLDELLLEDNDLIWADSNIQVQLLNLEGYVVLDSIGALPLDKIETNDFINASEGVIEPYVGSNKYTDEMTMSLTGPLKNVDGNVIGYLRFISSIEDTNKAVFNTSVVIIAFSLIVVMLTAIMSLIFAKSIVNPILELNRVAKKMADGQYKERSAVNSDDELGQLSRTLNSMAEEIIKKDQIKNDFISSISHELRTPLTSIKGWAVVLKGAKDEPTLMKDGLDIIESESDRLAKMVEELLDFSRFISGRIQLEKDMFNITDTCNDVAKQMKLRAESNKVDFIVEIDDVRALVIGDNNRIKQVLINLIDNAIKFTSENGWVKFKTYLEENQFIILVSDNGMGIAKEDLLHVKDKFYKGKHSKSHSGLGLSISDEITKLHGGNMDIYSEEKIGTTVKVVIPVTKNEKDEVDD